MKGRWIAVVVAGAMAVISQPAAAERVLRLTLQLPMTNVLGQNVSAFKEIVEREAAARSRLRSTHRRHSTKTRTCRRPSAPAPSKWALPR